MANGSRAYLGMRVGRRLLAMALVGLWLVGLSGCEVVGRAIELLEDISDGAPCAESAECLGGQCLKPSQGYPGGYCTTLECDKQGCSGLNSECFRLKVGEQQVAACLELCLSDGTCRRADEGYRCVVLDEQHVCLASQVPNARAQGEIGSPCTTDLQCGQGRTCLTSFLGGYCTKLECAAEQGAQACPGEDNACVVLNPEAETSGQVLGCLDGCQADGDCRHGYGCRDFGGQRVCLEKDAALVARNPDGADDGAACVANIGCKGASCIRETQGAEGTTWPGGYCATRGCTDDADCNGEALCVSRDRSTLCMASCTTDQDCRQGYTCHEGLGGRRYCEPRASAPDPGPTGAPLAESALELKCAPGRTLELNIPQGSTGFFVAPFTRENQKIVPKTLKFPSGQTLDLQRQYDFLAVNQEILRTHVPLLFPATDEAPLKRAFVPGRYVLSLETQAQEVCHYVLPKSAAGTKLDINLYFVGVPGVPAATASANADVKAFVDVMKSIYREMGVTVRVANYIEAEPAVAESYGIIRDIADIFALVATSRPVGTTLQEQLAVNVFLIEDFNVSEAPGLLGVSSGLPGMAGLHGTTGTGLVFSTASLGRDNPLLGQVMAHEVGHFLGLRHTTEHMGADHDPISDTPTCLFPNLGYICPDAKNFMFPFSLGSNQRGTTQGQSFVVRQSPLVK